MENYRATAVYNSRMRGSCPNMQFLIVCKYCVEPFFAKIFCEADRKNNVMKCGNQGRMVANSTARAPNPQLHQITPRLNPPAPTLLCSVQRSQKGQVLLVLIKLNASRTKNPGEEEHRACAVMEDTVTHRFPWWRSTHQAAWESMSHSPRWPKAGNSLLPWAAVLGTGTARPKTLRRLKTMFWEWPNRKTARLEPLAGHWSEQAGSFLSFMPLLMCGEVWRRPFPYLQICTSTNVNKWNKFNLEEEKMTIKINYQLLRR